MKPVILVVDDDRAMGELLSDVLGAHAFDVLVSQTGNDALAMVAQREKEIAAFQVERFYTVQLSCGFPAQSGRI